jgi:formate dehydrogenase maturation protein FdhE
MPDEEKEVAEKIFRKMNEQRWGEKCPTCGSQDPESLVFPCEGCGKMICSLCHNMTADYEQICGDCVKTRSLSRSDLELASDFLDI